nr:unnamed protein product [Spirometra erinaceieuropaei]
MFSAMLTDVYSDDLSGVCIAYGTERFRSVQGRLCRDPVLSSQRPAPPTPRRSTLLPDDGATSDAPSPVTITTSTPNSSDVDSVQPRPHCDRESTSHIDLVGHLQIRRSEAGEPVPGAPTYPRRICLNCPHYSRAFSQIMDLSDHMRIHENLR